MASFNAGVQLIELFFPGDTTIEVCDMRRQFLPFL